MSYEQFIEKHPPPPQTETAEKLEEHSLSVVAEPGSYLAVVDPAQFKQVFWNLARNAIHAMPRGGSLVVTLRQSSRGIAVTFEDSGEGMTTEDIILRLLESVPTPAIPKFS